MAELVNRNTLRMNPSSVITEWLATEISGLYAEIIALNVPFSGSVVARNLYSEKNLSNYGRMVEN